MSLIKKAAKTVAKKAVRPAIKAVVKPFTPPPGPSLGAVIKVAKAYNPVTGPVGAIRKVTQALKTLPPKASSTAKARAFGKQGALRRRAK